MEKSRPIRVLMAKPGLDGHDVGIKVVVQRLRNAGMEVIYSGLRQSVDQIISAAVQEAVEVIGLSVLSGSHQELAQELTEKLRAQKIEDILVIMGGIIPKEDIPKLKSLGVDGVFPVHSTLEEIETFIHEHVKARRKEALAEQGV